MSEAWNSSSRGAGPMAILYLKMRAAKLCCKSINRSRFSNIESRAREAFEKLQSIQEQALNYPSQQAFVEEEEARDEWIILAAAEQNFFQMKSRVRWHDKAGLWSAGDERLGSEVLFLSPGTFQCSCHSLRTKRNCGSSPFQMQHRVSWFAC
ncbi:hypothetical protein Rs2_13214 [Raphanus sativus]|nr:hypothetical protein Rs2_13214 [Raphanus sativus]